VLIKNSAIVLLVILFHGASSAQSNKRLNDMRIREAKIKPSAVNFELGGNGLFYSFNYDRVLIQMDHYKGSVRIGAGIIPYPESIKDNRTFLFLPVEYNNLFGPKQNFLEVSMGTTYNNSLQGGNWWMTGRVGYRLQPIDGGFMLRAGLVLLYIPFANPNFFQFATQDVILPMPAVSWGFSF